MRVEHEMYMQRCLQLAVLGSGHVAPNPMVGAVLVYEDRIIGEGYHREYGKPHAEVNCLGSVREEERQLIPRSTLYVSLEPCVHYGKTPPCSDLIIQNKISKVVIGSRDPFKEVKVRADGTDGNDGAGQGKGIEKLRSAGIEVTTGLLENECAELNRRFFTFHTKQRPYIILKWAQTADGKIAGNSSDRLIISCDYSNRIVHKWRAEEAAILVGTHTVEKDNPRLTNRLWTGRNPIRLVIDLNLRLDKSLHIFQNEAPTIIFNLRKNSGDLPGGLINQVYYYQVSKDISLVQQVLNACHQLNIQSILVEGGKKLLESFISEGLWDEARIITNTKLYIGKGLPAPGLIHAKQTLTEQVIDDSVSYFKNSN